MISKVSVKKIGLKVLDDMDRVNGKKYDDPLPPSPWLVKMRCLRSMYDYQQSSHTRHSRRDV